MSEERTWPQANEKDPAFPPVSGLHLSLSDLRCLVPCLKISPQNSGAYYLSMEFWREPVNHSGPGVSGVTLLRAVAITRLGWVAGSASRTARSQDHQPGVGCW